MYIGDLTNIDLLITSNYYVHLKFQNLRILQNLIDILHGHIIWPKSIHKISAIAFGHHSAPFGLASPGATAQLRPKSPAQPSSCCTSAHLRNEETKKRRKCHLSLIVFLVHLDGFGWLLLKLGFATNSYTNSAWHVGCTAKLLQQLLCFLPCSTRTQLLQSTLAQVDHYQHVNSWHFSSFLIHSFCKPL